MTLSIAEVEYVAAMHTTKECIWLHCLIGEILSTQSESITMYCDNQATLKLTQGDNYHARMKHIDIHYHFIRDVVKKGYIKLQYCPMDDMMADILTKVLLCWKVNQHALGLGLCCPCRGVFNLKGSGAHADEVELC